MSSISKARLISEEETKGLLRGLLMDLREAVRAQGLELADVRVDWKLNDRDELVVAAVIPPRCRGEWLILLSDDEAQRRFRRSKPKPPGHGFW